MPKPKTDAIHRHFEYDEITNTSKCKLCGIALKGKHTTNLKNHMSLKHTPEYQAVVNINKSNKENHPSLSSLKQSKIESVKNNCLKLVTIHGRPFSLLQDKAFQDIIDIALPEHNKKKYINSSTVKLMVPDKAYEIRGKIAAEVRRKLISLKLDAATYMDRRFIGINIQYLKNGKIIIRTLGTVEVVGSHTGEFLKNVLRNILIQYRIMTSQIYSITTDNGKNFIKMSKLMGATYESQEFNYENAKDNDDDEDEDEDGDDIQDTMNPIILEDPSSAYNFLDLDEEMDKFKPRGMFCAAHTLHLTIKDAIESNQDVQTILYMARQIVKKLKTPTINSIIKMSGYRKAILDCPTRWTSTFNMLVRLVSLKSVCQTIFEVNSYISDDFWHNVEEVVECLQPANTATLLLQKEQITLGDFYCIWISYKLKLENIRKPFAISLLDAIKKREAYLLNLDVMLEAIYMDCRLNIILSDEQLAKARLLLKETYKQICNVAHDEDNTEVNNITNSTVSENMGIDEDNCGLQDLERILIQTEIAKGRALPASQHSIDVILNNIATGPRLSLTENIIEYWSSKSLTLPSKVSMLANTVLAVPSTQVSIERLFSSLHFILSPLRNKLSPALLQDLMVIRSNHDLFD